MPHGDSRNILHDEVAIIEGKEGEAKEAAFHLAADRILAVQGGKS